MSAQFEVLLEISDGLAVLAVHGEVDMHSSPKVREAQGKALQGGTRGVVVDLSGVGYMDSSGIATLIEGLQRAKREGRNFRLVGLTPSVRDVFDLARLADVFEIFTTRDEALKAT
ncbi:MAG: STAS domain-containing protein [Deltaproteobacteria bacterium]|nr:STAS domain-containing protein [Deltaproteobacteria bacterium]